MRRSRPGYWLVAPVAGLYLALFVAPFVYFLAISFFSMKNYRLDHGLTLANYARTLEKNSHTLGFTLGLAATIAGVTVIVGFLYSYIMRFKAPRQANLLLLLAILTLFGGYLMKIYAWKTILGTQGVLNTGLLALGLVREPIGALFYNPFAVIVTLVNFLLPMAILPIYSAMRGIRDIEIEVARDLGATPLATLRDIVIPRSAPGIAGAFALCFLLSVGDYVTPTLVGGTMATMGNMIAPQFGSFFNWPLGAAMSFTTLAAAMLAVGVVVRLLGRLGRA